MGPIVIFLAIAVVMLAAVYLAVRLLVGMIEYTDHDQPHCEVCGQPVQDVDKLACPQCGADLRETGIRVPHHTFEKALVMGAMMLGWTIVIGVAFAIVYPIVRQRASIVTQELSLHLVSVDDVQRISLTIEMPANLSVAPPDTCHTSTGTELLLDPVISAGMMQMHLNGWLAGHLSLLPGVGGTYYTGSTAHTVSWPPSDADVLAWYRQTLLPNTPARPQLSAESRELAQLIDGIATGRSAATLNHFALGAYGFQQFVQYSKTVDQTLFVVWFALVLIGNGLIAGITQRHYRRKRLVVSH